MQAESSTLHRLSYAESCDLAPGERVRSRRHPELTGRVRCYEWHSPGVLSAIPYNVEWDDNSRAFDVLGWFAIYASDETIEPLPVTRPPLSEVPPNV